MLSFPDRNSVLPGGACPPGTHERWNTRLHYLLGLLLLFFVWLFAVTGLLLNHSQWKFTEFWENRRQTKFEGDIVAPASAGELARAREVMQQLGLRGEIEWTATGNNPRRLDFRVSRPGHVFDIKTDLAARKASVQRIDLNAWGVMRILHTFTGVRIEDARNQRDWVLTTAWALAMDVLAVGLILMVGTGYFIWFARRQKRLSGAIVLVMGTLICGVFCVGLRWGY